MGFRTSEGELRKRGVAEPVREHKTFGHGGCGDARSRSLRKSRSGYGVFHSGKKFCAEKDQEDRNSRVGVQGVRHEREKNYGELLLSLHMQVSFIKAIVVLY